MTKTTTACPLDCYDACSIEVRNKKLIGEEGHPYTAGYLCRHINRYSDFQRITSPSYKGNAISIEESKKILAEILENSENSILHYRGSGNMGLMQGVTDHFFASYGATLTSGSLCDGAGSAGIIKGRGSNVVYDSDEMHKSEVIVIWGRNVETTNTHMVPLLRDKTVVVIDPYETNIAKNADLFLQIKPKSDLPLALALAWLAFENKWYDTIFLERFGKNYKAYRDFLQTIDMDVMLEASELQLDSVTKLLQLIYQKRCMILIGLGPQKYEHGAQVVHAIDSFGALMGLHANEGCGVNFLGASQEGMPSPFQQAQQYVSKVNCELSNFRTVFVQGANPVEQMPDSARVIKSLEGVENLIYFGLYENETSKKADLVLPSKTFLEKEDIRVGYAHHYLMSMPQQYYSDIGISEYELSAFLCQHFNVNIATENSYIKHYESYSDKGIYPRLKHRSGRPYQDGFNFDDKQFVFIHELPSMEDDVEGFFLLTSKSKKSINSQFKRDKFVYLHPNLGYSNGEQVMLTSEYGSVRLNVVNDVNLREDSLLVYSGTPGVNFITSSQLSSQGDNAIYQEQKVKIIKV